LGARGTRIVLNHRRVNLPDPDNVTRIEGRQI
jgi:hypothetical protein